jgi:hypothetical protein
VTATAARFRLATLAPLLVLSALLALVVADGPTVLRLTLAVAGVTVAAGAPIVGLLSLPRTAARRLLVVGASLTVAVLVSGILVLAGNLTATTGAVSLWIVSLVATGARVMARESVEADPRGAGVLGWWRRWSADLAAAPRRSVLLTAAAAVLWIVALVVVEPRGAGDVGMITAFPAPWWLGIALLLAAFVGHVRLGVRPALALLQVGLLLAFLYVIMTIAEPYARIPTSYTHVGLVDYIVRDHRIASSFDGRYSWPGSLALGAMLTQLAGVESSAAFVRWAIPAFTALWALAVYVVATAYASPQDGRWTHPARRATPWIAVWLFLLLNWVGQDYWSSQALNFFLVLVAIGAVATWLPRRPRGAGTPPFLPDEQPAPLTGGQRAGLFLIVVAIAAVVASSHQLSPFMLTGALVALWLVDRRDIRFLALLAGVLTLTWVSWGAMAYWLNHLSILTDDVGEVGDVVTAGTAARIAEGSSGRQVVLAVRLLVSMTAWLGAAGCFILVLRRHRPAITVAALVGVPFGAVAMQEYGGELGLRIFLFSLPFVALLQAEGVRRFVQARWQRPAAAAAAGVVAAALLVPAFVVARYGNEKFEQVYAEDVAVVEEFYRVAPPGAVVLGNNTSNPFRGGPFHDYEPAEFEGLGHPDEVDVEARLREAGIGDGYVIVFESGIQEALLREGAAPGWERDLHEELIGFGATERFRQGRAALYEFHLEGVEPDPGNPARTDRSLASPAVRSRLDRPALAVVAAVLVFLLVAGARQIAGRRRFGWSDLVAWVGVHAVVAIVFARFLAFT